MHNLSSQTVVTTLNFVRLESEIMVYSWSKPLSLLSLNVCNLLNDLNFLFFILHSFQVKRMNT